MPQVAEMPVLAEFHYMLRGPRKTPRFGLIQVGPYGGAIQSVDGDFAAAVAAARTQASRAVKDDFHAVPINPAYGVLQAADGALSIAPLGGFHRDAWGSVFIDGDFFERAALSVQIARRSAELLAVVGTERVADLRTNGGSATIVARRGGA